VRRPRVPLAIKLADTVWMAVWVPLYWHENGWTNFLWICDFANFGLFVALWAESALVATSQLAGVLVIQTLWTVDFLGALLGGRHLIGGTEYMFDASRPLWLRGLSLFHIWTVPALVWVVRRLGYDRRGWRLEAAIAAVLLPAGQWLGTREQNLNWMWAPFGRSQTWLPPLPFAAIAVVLVTLVLILPGDWITRRWLARGRMAPEVLPRPGSGTGARPPRPAPDG
jgi:hypothetical protein